MIKLFQQYITQVVIVATIVMCAGALPVAAAYDPIAESCKVDPTSELCKNKSDNLFGPDSIWTKIVNTLIYITGAIAVIMIVVGGMRFTLSGGDAAGTKSARETIIYAVVGLGVAIMSYAIVNFVLSRL